MFQQGFETLQAGGEGKMGTPRKGYRAEARFHLGCSEQSFPSHQHLLADMDQGSWGMRLEQRRWGCDDGPRPVSSVCGSHTGHGLATLSRPEGE